MAQITANNGVGFQMNNKGHLGLVGQAGNQVFIFDELGLNSQLIFCVWLTT